MLYYDIILSLSFSFSLLNFIIKIQPKQIL